MRRLLAAVVLLAGCSSAGGSAATTTTGQVTMRLTVHALGETYTWSHVGDRCVVGGVRVEATDGDGNTVAVETVPVSGPFTAPHGDCTSDPVEVTAAPADFYRLTVSGTGPLQARWQAAGQFTRSEVEHGVVATARASSTAEAIVVAT